MKTIKLKQLLILFVGLSLTQSCGLSVDIAKRKHRSGYFVSIQKAEHPSGQLSRSNSQKIEMHEQLSPVDLTKREDQILHLEPEELITSSQENDSHSLQKSSIQKSISNVNQTQRRNKQNTILSSKASKSGKSNFLTNLFFGSIVSSLLLFKLFRKRTKNIIFWANKNKWASRIFIALSQTALGIVAFTSGLLGEVQHLNLKMGLALSGLVVVHLIKKNISRLGNFLFQKLRYFVFGLSLLSLLHVGGAYQQNNHHFDSFRASAQKVVNTLEVKQQEKTGDDTVEIIVKVLLSILVIAGLLILSYLLFILACTLYCNGALGLAAFVSIGGLIGVILLGVFLFLLIWKKRPKKAGDEKKKFGWATGLLLVLTFGILAFLSITLNQ